ncbi:MAG: GNAT family N-acetyltransferase, partial [Candidatus Dormibacteraeota bacterium]|nr:GNAT family N-acetyltransferase [Candidatus Dormibacteraeota bacterium]
PERRGPGRRAGGGDGRLTPPPSALVRSLRADEVERWRDVRLRALRDSPAAFGSRYENEVGRPLSDWALWAAGLAAGAGRVMFVLDSGQRWRGCAGGLEEAGKAWLVSMWVEPPARGQGLGRRLVEAVVGWAAGRGHDRLHLWVVQGNETASGLYRSCGFVPTGVSQPVGGGRPDVEQEMVRPFS